MSVVGFLIGARTKSIETAEKIDSPLVPKPTLRICDHRFCPPWQRHYLLLSLCVQYKQNGSSTPTYLSYMPALYL